MAGQVLCILCMKRGGGGEKGEEREGCYVENCHREKEKAGGGGESHKEIPNRTAEKAAKMPLQERGGSQKR